MADLQASVKNAIGDKHSRRDAGAPSQSGGVTSLRKSFSSRGLKTRMPALQQQNPCVMIGGLVQMTKMQGFCE